MSNNTKRALSASLKKLLETEPLDKITVTDITDGCGVKRQTFYYHFKDIFDLITWTYRTDAEDAIAAHGKQYATWQEGLTEMFEVVGARDRERGFVLATYNSKCRDDLIDYLERITHDRLQLAIDSLSGTAIPATDRAFITSFYTHAFVGIVMDWIEGGMAEVPSEIINRLELFVSNDFQRALSSFAQKNGQKLPVSKPAAPSPYCKTGR